MSPRRTPIGNLPPGKPVYLRGKVRLYTKPSMRGPAGILRIFVLALPLIFANAVHGINQFMDQMFLSWHDAEQFTASLQSGMFYFALLIFFQQTLMYNTTFVAQFIGAKQEKLVGAMTWQAFYVMLISCVPMLLLAPEGYRFFDWLGHAGNIPQYEGEFFYYMALGTPVFLFNMLLFSYFMGLGQTGLVLFSSIIMCVLNVCLNTWMIFEQVLFFPSGIGGAACASIISRFAGSLILVLFLFTNKRHATLYHLFSGWRFHFPLFKRLLQFGVPSGVQAIVDLMGFTVFMLLVGLFGYTAQHSSNMAMNLNWLLFVPALGFHNAVQILAGQLCGARDFKGVEKMTFTAALINMAYMVVVIYFYVGIPETFLSLFRGGMPQEEWLPLLALAKNLLIIVAVYSIGDALMLVYTGVLKGAGDTTYVMLLTLFYALLFLMLPCIILAGLRGWFPATPLLYIAWGMVAAYIASLAWTCIRRFQSGYWKRLRLVKSG